MKRVFSPGKNPIHWSGDKGHIITSTLFFHEGLATIIWPRGGIFTWLRGPSQHGKPKKSLGEETLAQVDAFSAWQQSRKQLALQAASNNETVGNGGKRWTVCGFIHQIAVAIGFLIQVI